MTRRRNSVLETDRRYAAINTATAAQRSILKFRSVFRADQIPFKAYFTPMISYLLFLLILFHLIS